MRCVDSTRANIRAHSRDGGGSRARARRERTTVRDIAKLVRSSIMGAIEMGVVGGESRTYAAGTLYAAGMFTCIERDERSRPTPTRAMNATGR